MDKEDDRRINNKTVSEGLIFKSASVETQNVTDSDLKKINQFTLTELNAEEVFTFKLIMGDNEIDDRNYEPFNLNALKDMKKLYTGKTIIKDHNRIADNQIARIYDTELIQDNNKSTGANEIFTKLVAKCYMIKTQSNQDLIAEIKAGIKKEVSTNCKPKHAYCSICGTDNTKTYCNHYWGREYDTVNGKKVCYFTLDGVKEAYEVSFVAVPAQIRACTIKVYGSSKEEQEDDGNTSNETQEFNKFKKSELNLKIKSLDFFIFIEKEKEKNDYE